MYYSLFNGILQLLIPTSLPTSFNFNKVDVAFICEQHQTILSDFTTHSLWRIYCAVHISCVPGGAGSLWIERKDLKLYMLLKINIAVLKIDSALAVFI